MSAYPSIVAKPMAVEPTTALESAAAQLEMDQQVLLSGAEVEQSSLKQWRACTKSCLHTHPWISYQHHSK